MGERLLTASLVPITRVRLNPVQAAEADDYSPEAMASRRGLDLRLVPVALALWFTVAATVVGRSWWPPLCAGGVGCLTTLGVWWLGRNPHRRFAGTGGSIVMAVGVSLGASGIVGALGASTAMVRMEVIQQHPWVSDSGQHNRTHTGWVQVAASPRVLDSGSVLVPVRTELGTLPLFFSPQYAYGSQVDLAHVLPGQHIDVAFRVRASDGSRPAMVPLTLSATRSANGLREATGLWSVSAALRKGLDRAARVMPGSSGVVLPGMTVGDVSLQSAELQQQFVDTGLSHLSAVSGANCAIVMSAALIVATIVGAGRWLRLGASAVAMLGFVCVVGPEPSVLRAAVMGSLGLVAVAASRWRDIIASACWAVMLLVVVDPNLAVSYGFMLSLAATVGIVLLGPWLSRGVLGWWWRYTEHRWGRRPPAWHGLVVRVVMISVAADVVTAPIIMHMAGRMSLVAVLANVMVAWAVPVVTVVGLVVACVGCCPWIPDALLALVAIPAAIPGWWIQWVAVHLSRAPVVTAEASVLSAVVVALPLVALVVSMRARRRGGHRPWWSQVMWGPSILVWAIALRWGGFEVQSSTQRGTWEPPPVVKADPAHTVTVPDDRAALRVVSGMAELIIVTECGAPTDRPSITPRGIPVIYPCRDGIQVDLP